MSRRMTPALPENTAPVANRRCYPTGCGLLDLAFSGILGKGPMSGSMINVIGGSSSGKTLALLTMYAATAHNPDFNDVELVYNPVEKGCEFDLQAMFGKKTADRVVISPTRTALEFQRDIRNRMEKGPVLYGLDSFDGMTTDEELKFIETKLEEKKEPGQKGKGSYGMEKAKFSSQFFRTMMSEIEASGSLLFLISQVRDDTSITQYSALNRSGGHALDFYSHHIVWLSLVEKIMVERRGCKTHIGNRAEWKFSKCRANGKLRRVELPIYTEIGVDEIEAAVQWLDEHKYALPKDGAWAGVKGGNSTLQLCRSIDEHGLREDLNLYLGECWKDFEQECSINRKNRWADEPTAN